ncbi:MAG: hypothetical protein J7K36_07985 [Archaeoglobaceae archaeon]|nr:hypothetical protein [Archaeoglobaceae archaeon]
MNRKSIKTIIDILLLTGLAVMGITGDRNVVNTIRKDSKNILDFLGLEKQTLGDIHLLWICNAWCWDSSPIIKLETAKNTIEKLEYIR